MTEVAPSCTAEGRKVFSWLGESKGYSVQTHRSRLSILRNLMNYLQGSSLLLADVQSTDIDSYLKERHYNGCNRRTIAGLVSVLRCFFRYAADRQWVKDDLWKTLSAPRLYTMEQLPSYLHWDDVKLSVPDFFRLLGSSTSRHIAAAFCISLMVTREVDGKSSNSMAVS